ncbi:hypothetical protein BJ138DRAFT_837348 [Hygrophoropsis aurantiaca]|uniref:Uncharacterized protein n=1 Tax=Hygrophoropsis aurantiaca TaxID=72124 RepID=A0ACB8AFK9_9AGAM|nr:hypothetical protein BJ138DRAFT_837348 [Hygrophoropsis aurantiaca]
MYVTKSAGTNDPTLREDIWKNVRATLHLSAMLSTSCDHYKEGSSRQWLSTYHCGHDSLFNIDGPEWAVSFLKHHYDVHDDTAVADTFFMLSQSRNVKQWADSTLFMDALVFAMQGDQPVHVRHTALRTVWKMRHVLTQPNSVLLSSSQLSEFSSALYSAVSTNIHAPDDSNTDNSSDRFFSVERDMYYLQIIYTFSLNAQIVDIWNTCLRWHGHLERCRDLALYLGDTRMLTAQSAYLLAILEIVESHKIECNFVAAFNQELRRGHLICAWSLTAGLKPAALDLFPIEELLPTMIAFTSRYQDTYGLVKPTTLYKNPGRLLRNLRRNRPQSQAMIKLLKEKIPTWERR